jgi:uncharacterized protein YjbI with pentapeptide repeats
LTNPEHASLIRRNVTDWNAWRQQYPEVRPDLRGAELRGLNLDGADLRATDLREADLTNTSLLSVDLSQADLRWSILLQANLNKVKAHFAQFDEASGFEATMIQADLTSASLCNVNLNGTNLNSAILTKANLQGASMRRAILRFANLNMASLRKAQLTQADLTGADLAETDLTDANLESAVLVGACLRASLMTGAHVFGASVWDTDTALANQENLVISSEGQPIVTVDRLEIAQFIYLLLRNEKLREVIDSVTSKLVLILGRFSPDRKAILDRVRQELRNRGYVPVLFDFAPPTRRDLTETISTLAHLAKFVIADITDARSVPQELMRIVPNLPSVPIQPILSACDREYGMFETFKRYPWVLETFFYENEHHLVENFESAIVAPAERASRRT